MNYRAKTLKSVFGILTLACALAGSPLAATAQKGGGGAGGGSGGGSGGGAVITVVPIKMNNYATPFNGVLSQGTVTFSYSKDSLTQSMDIKVSNINVPDGTEMQVESLEAIRVTGRCWHYEPYFYKMTIIGGKGSLNFSTDRGEFVPMVDPNKGWTQVIVSDTASFVRLMDGFLPFKGIL